MYPSSTWIYSGRQILEVCDVSFFSRLVMVTVGVQFLIVSGFHQGMFWDHEVLSCMVEKHGKQIFSCAYKFPVKTCTQI